MADAGDPRRVYRSQLRERQARETRRVIVAAAAELFIRQGYAATTLDAVAEAAGVSRKTVFNVAGGKAALLKLAWDWSLVGDDEPIPMAERPAVKQVQASTDPAESIRLWVDMVAEITERSAPIGRVLAAAADVDPEAAALLAQADQERYLGARAFVGHLAGLDGLRPELTVDRAADVFWALTDPTVLRRLVIDRKWPLTDFRDWLTTTVMNSLLPD